MIGKKIEFNVKCKQCGDTGILGTGEFCSCRIQSFFQTYLKRYLKYGRPAERLQKLVEHLIKSHKGPNHWLMMPALYSNRNTMSTEWQRLIYGVKDVSKELKDETASPESVYNQFFLHYLVTTNTFHSFMHFNISELINAYYSYDNNVQMYFYNNRHKTFLIEFTNVLYNKELYNILLHFIDTYKDRNILIWADPKHHEAVHYYMKGENAGPAKKISLGTKGLNEVLFTAYGNTFVNVFEKESAFIK